MKYIQPINATGYLPLPLTTAHRRPSRSFRVHVSYQVVLEQALHPTKILAACSLKQGKIESDIVSNYLLGLRSYQVGVDADGESVNSLITGDSGPLYT